MPILAEITIMLLVESYKDNLIVNYLKNEFLF